MRSYRTAVYGIIHHREFGRFVRFSIVGATGAALNLSILYLLTSAGLHYLFSGAIAIESALLFNFFLNKIWTFGDINLTGVVETLRALLRDHEVRLGGMGLNLVILWALTDFFGLFYLLSQVVGAGVAAIWNFTGNLFWTWKT